MSPDPTKSTHYDLLGLSPKAKPAAIQRAWRKQTAKEGPGSARLAELNAAAEVLLDPVRRASYDEELRRAEPAAPAVADGDVGEAGEKTTRPRRRVWLLAVLCFLAIAALVLAGVLTWQNRVRNQEDRAATEAQAVVERSLKWVLSYDYRQLEEDRERAKAALTSDLAKEFDKTYDNLLAKNKDGSPGAAIQTKTVVTADTVAAAVMDASSDEVTVLAFVNQTSTHGEKDPRTFANRVRVVLEKVDGRWLIDELDPR